MTTQAEQVRVKLSPAQRSALECRDGGGLDLLTDAAWGARADYLEFAAVVTDALADELTEACNAEDGQAEEPNTDAESRRFARDASRALGSLAAKVRKMGTRKLNAIATKKTS